MYKVQWLEERRSEQWLSWWTCKISLNAMSFEAGSLLHLRSRFFTDSAYNFGPRMSDALPVPMKQLEMASNKFNNWITHPVSIRTRPGQRSTEVVCNLRHCLLYSWFKSLSHLAHDYLLGPPTNYASSWIVNSNLIMSCCIFGVLKCPKCPFALFSRSEPPVKLALGLSQRGF